MVMVRARWEIGRSIRAAIARRRMAPRPHGLGPCPACLPEFANAVRLMVLSDSSYQERASSREYSAEGSKPKQIFSAERNFTCGKHNRHLDHGSLFISCSQQKYE